MRKAGALLTGLVSAFAVSTVIAATTPVSAQEVEFPTITTDVHTDACPLNLAVTRSFDELRALDASEEGCVALNGLWALSTFYEDVDSYYLANAGPSSWEPFAGQIGVYGWRDRAPDPTQIGRVRVSGSLGHCADHLWDYRGYCGTRYEGMFLALGEVEITGPAPSRLIGSEHRARLGQLTGIDPVSPLGSTLEAKALAWLAALKAGNPVIYAQTYVDVDNEWSGALAAEMVADPETALHDVLVRDGTVFRRLAGQNNSELRLWRVSAPPPAPDEPPADAGDYEVVACFKLGTWSDDRWPSAFVDANNADSRPYACIDIWRRTTDGRIDEQVEVRGGGNYGLAEPDWSK